LGETGENRRKVQKKRAAEGFISYGNENITATWRDPFLP